MFKVIFLPRQESASEAAPEEGAACCCSDFLALRVAGEIAKIRKNNKSERRRKKNAPVKFFRLKRLQRDNEGGGGITTPTPGTADTGPELMRICAKA